MNLSQTWVVVEDDVEEVLVPPCDVEFVFLEERHQKLLPAQRNTGHVILSRKQQSHQSILNQIKIMNTRQSRKGKQPNPHWCEPWERKAGHSLPCSPRASQTNDNSDLLWSTLVVQQSYNGRSMTFKENRTNWTWNTQQHNINCSATIPWRVCLWCASCSWAWPQSWPPSCRSRGVWQSGCTRRCAAPRAPEPWPLRGWSWRGWGRTRSPPRAAGRGCRCRRTAESPRPSESADWQQQKENYKKLFSLIWHSF